MVTRLAVLSVPFVVTLLFIGSLPVSAFGSESGDQTFLPPTWAVQHDVACKVPTGKVDDASCDVDAVEQANSDQLHSILHELMNTTYFRLISISLEGKCKYWDKSISEAKCTAQTPVNPFAAAAANIPPPPQEKSQCSLDTGGTKVPAKEEEPELEEKDPYEDVDLDDDDDDEDDDFDDDDEDEDESPNFNPLKYFSRYTKTTDKVDMEISSREQATLELEPCDNASLPDFWLDMCRNIPTNTSDYLNLQLNPERWTGYNGSHVWEAIYIENCFEKMGDLEEMCYEERVLYRLLSGMHASINIHISLNYFPPSKRHNRSDWAPNVQRFMDQYGTRPERIKNLHFAFLVLLRSLRKAAPYLYNYPFSLGDGVEDRRTQRMVQRLLDSHLMTSCGQVFEAFDESLMFREEEGGATTQARLKAQWKGVFHNISTVMDCISCQKCKLHGKIQLLGMGTALKILLLPEQLIAASLTRNELVALFNTLAKFSHAIRSVPILAQQFLQFQRSYRTEILSEQLRSSENSAAPPPPSVSSLPPPSASASFSSSSSFFSPSNTVKVPVDVALDSAMAALAAAGMAGRIPEAEEDVLVDGLLARDEDLLLLARHYAPNSPDRFLRHAARRARTGAIGRGPRSVSAPPAPPAPVVDAVVIGGGLAGLSAALTMLDRGGRVVLLEKQGHLGGNSAWASSGVNAVDVNNTASGDSVDAFTADTVKGAGRGDNPLIPVLTSGSVDALAWLRGRLSEHLSLDLVGQLGGHSFPRTHRPSSGLAGSAMIFAIQKQLDKYAQEREPRLQLMKWTKATKLLTDESGAVVGVKWEVVGPPSAVKEGRPMASGEVYASNVLIATGGYASDYTEDSLLKEHRPDLLKYATTNNKGTTGDGHKLALAVGAKGVDLDDVQVHPTGFFNPRDPDNKVKTLCAEILRGVGGILLNRWGERFANELGTRDYVTGRMIEADPETLKFAQIMNAEAAKKAETHIGLYTKKELIRKFETLEELAAWDYWDGKVSAGTLERAFAKYDADAKTGRDAYNKTFFHNVPVSNAAPYYAGIVTPVIHYCMGGIAISPDGSVLRDDGSAIPGLHAAGEVIGGLHGKNRLGGNALSEALVFGRAIGNKLEIGKERARQPPSPPTPPPTGGGAAETGAGGSGGLKQISKAEMATHKTEESCWVSINDKVYDFTNFLDEHPAGAEAILRFGGQDGTEIFEAIHTPEMLEDFTPIGDLVA